jgi:peptide subunit release factor 1 (eRF1)
MITRAEVEKLSTVHTVEPTMLSLYLTVPLDPAEPRGLATRADDLITAASGRAGRTVADADRAAVRAAVASHGRDWLGHTVAVFACADAGLSEVLPLPCELPERAVIGTRAHIRPLLAALQQCPAYRVAVVDRRHAWVFSVAGDEIGTVSLPDAAGVPSSHFGGWHGLDAYQVHERVIQLARHHYRDTAAILAEVMRHGEQEPLVIGGHGNAIKQFLASLPPSARAAFAGSFAADPRTLTAARVASLAAPVVARWAGQRAQRFAAEILEMPPDLAATGLLACLAAVNASAVDLLAVPDDGLVPGYVCGRCGALSSVADDCPDWGTASQPVPDLIEEMVTRTLEDGGQVAVVRDAPGGISARLRFPVAQPDHGASR